MKWDTGVMIDNYLVQVKLKEREGIYYAQADSFFLVASSGKNMDECLYNLKKVFLRVRELVFVSLLNEYGIEKPSPI